MMTAEMQNLGRRVDFSVARSHQLFVDSTHIVGSKTNRLVSVGFDVGFGRFWTVSEVSGALGGAPRRVLSVKC